MRQVKADIPVLSIQPGAYFPFELMLSENDPRVLERSPPVRNEQSLGFLRGHFQAPAIQPALRSPQTSIDPQLKDSDVVSGEHDECVICEADDARSSRKVHAQEVVVHDVPNEWTHP